MYNVWSLKMTSQKLNYLFNQIDDWFKNINEPISQFSLDDDREKLSQILTTTGEWFEILAKPPLTRITVENDHLDSLAKDLERLLEDVPNESEYFHFYYNPDESIALLDDSIGRCCEIPLKTIEERSASKKESYHIKVVQNSEYEVPAPRQTSSLSTPVPQDHDYLAKPNEPLLNNHKILDLQNRSVINIDALKKFARFSQRFTRVLHKTTS